jgi:hypothetical protein
MSQQDSQFKQRDTPVVVGMDVGSTTVKAVRGGTLRHRVLLLAGPPLVESPGEATAFEELYRVPKFHPMKIDANIVETVAHMNCGPISYAAKRSRPTDRCWRSSRAKRISRTTATSRIQPVAIQAVPLVIRPMLLSPLSRRSP